MTPSHPVSCPAAVRGDPWTTIEQTGKLQQGDHAAALERIAAHERHFPNGRLSLMREALRESALGAAGGSPERGER
jgi:hypothetical protein